MNLDKNFNWDTWCAVSPSQQLAIEGLSCCDPFMLKEANRLTAETINRCGKRALISNCKQSSYDSIVEDVAYMNFSVVPLSRYSSMPLSKIPLKSMLPAVLPEV